MRALANWGDILVVLAVLVLVGGILLGVVGVLMGSGSVGLSLIVAVLPLGGSLWLLSDVLKTFSGIAKDMRRTADALEHLARRRQRQRE